MRPTLKPRPYRRPHPEDYAYQVLADVMTVTEAAATYHYCERHIRGLAQDGRIAARKTIDGYWLVERHSVQSYADRWKKTNKLS
jgi:hypothetical protein